VKVELKITIIYNGYMGMVRQWQGFLRERYNATPMFSRTSA
jgi:thiamine pyrophosphate-dependent acetolactate synthase large subunit-like protein